MTFTLAYYNMALITAVKGYRVQAFERFVAVTTKFQKALKFLETAKILLLSLCCVYTGDLSLKKRNRLRLVELTLSP